MLRRRESLEQLRRDKVQVARCTVARLMRRLGLRRASGAAGSSYHGADGKAVCPLDKVQRQFHADRPNRLWVSGLYIRIQRGRAGSM